MSDTDTNHLDNLSDGAGCTEIWEHLSEQRAAAAAEDDEADDETTDAAATDSTAEDDDETTETETKDAALCSP